MPLSFTFCLFFFFPFNLPYIPYISLRQWKWRETFLFATRQINITIFSSLHNRREMREWSGEKDRSVSSKWAEKPAFFFSKAPVPWRIEKGNKLLEYFSFYVVVIVRKCVSICPDFQRPRDSSRVTIAHQDKREISQCPD